jgi:REP element-mobilizing transposase RayT
LPPNPDHRHRRTLRLPGYDYAQTGAYFVTICAECRACLFGEIIAGEMHRNGAGQMLAERWARLQSKYAVKADEFIVMPNHVHGILIVEGIEPAMQAATGQPHVAAPTQSIAQSPLGTMVGWFKAMTSNAYIRGVKQQGWPPFDGRLWQRNYYEHIVRGERNLAAIREYINANPARWADDPENPSMTLRRPM